MMGCRFNEELTSQQLRPLDMSLRGRNNESSQRRATRHTVWAHILLYCTVLLGDPSAANSVVAIT